MSEIDYDVWEPVIGLEIHVQLNTKTKLFTRTLNNYGDEPNTNIDELDTAQPGSLPILNKEAVTKAIALGIALKSHINPFSTFDRKSYFYPDCPRNFQITQFYHPIIIGGTVTCDVEGVTKHFSIDRAHLEDDAGMLKHFSSFAGVDFNRAGAPLIEIVSKPNLHSPKDASSYAMAIRSLLQYLDVANCNMEEGGMRMDANISVRKKGEEGLRPRIEVKNMNSFHNMELAIESEIRRQIIAYERNPDKDHKAIVEPGTYRFDLQKKQTVMMRKKQDAHDYRYFHEPDLVPIVLKQEQIDAIRETLPELPHERYNRYVEKLQLAKDSAAILVQDKGTSDFFEEALTHTKSPSLLCNWIITEFAGRLKELGKTLKESGLTSDHVGQLVALIETKTITGRMAKEIADLMLQNPEKDPREIVKADPKFQPVQDTSVIEPIVDQILADNPQSITDYHAGRTKALAFLVGQVMKATKGKASPDLVNELILKKIQKS